MFAKKRNRLWLMTFLASATTKQNCSFCQLKTQSISPISLAEVTHATVAMGTKELRGTWGA